MRLLSAVIPQLIMEDDDRLGLRLVSNTRLQHPSLIALLSTFVKESATSRLSPPSRKQRQGLSNNGKVVSPPAESICRDTHHSQLNRPSL